MVLTNSLLLLKIQLMRAQKEDFEQHLASLETSLSTKKHPFSILVFLEAFSEHILELNRQFLIQLLFIIENHFVVSFFLFFQLLNIRTRRAF